MRSELTAALVATALAASAPPARAATEMVLYSFAGYHDGCGPHGPLLLDASGNLYGTTSGGGAPAYAGTVFRLAPPGPGQTAWTAGTWAVK